MADDLLKAFDTLLDRTVRSPRLSGSKVKELQEAALKLVAHDHHLVTSLLKLNTSLPAASTQRISSLYVFDAIARAAKSASKADPHATNTERGRGTPASLLAKMEGVVDSWVEGMVDDGRGGVWSEGRDKTRKIVDIWRKVGTFPDRCIAQLASRIAAAGTPAGRSPAGPILDKPARSTTPTPPPPIHLIERYATRAMGGASDSPSATPQPAGQLPPEIMAMLGVGAAKPATPEAVVAPATRQPNAALDAVLANVRKPAAPNLDTASLAALANLGATLGQPAQPAQPPGPAPAAALLPRPVVPAANGDRNGHSDRDGGTSRDRRRSRSPERWRAPPPPREWDDRTDRGPRDARDERREPRRPSWGEERDRDPRDMRGPPRDYRDPRDRDYPPPHDLRDRDPRGDRDTRGPPRDWDERRERDYPPRDRDPRDRDPRDRERDPRGRDPRSRDRDPRGERDFAPPRDRSRSETRSTLPPKPDGLPPRPTPPGANVPLPRRRSPPPRGDGWRDDRPPREGEGMPTSGHGAPAPFGRHGGGGHGGSLAGGGGGATLDTFDWSTFNPADGGSWASLGQAWLHSTGREPNQMELMQFMIAQMGGGGGAGGEGGGGGMGGGGGGDMMGGMGMMGMSGMGGSGMGGMGMGGMGGMGFQ